MARERSEGIEMFFYTIVEVGGKLPDVAVAAFLLSRADHRYIEVSVEPPGCLDGDAHAPQSNRPQSTFAPHGSLVAY